VLRFLMEAYEGIAVVTTLDPHLGLVELSVAPGCEAEVAHILNTERTNLRLRRIWPERMGMNPDFFDDMNPFCRVAADAG